MTDRVIQVPSGQALHRMALAAQANGVNYLSGDAGYVKKLLYDDSGRCIGCLSADGHAHIAEVVILSTGANTAALIDAKDEIVARSHCVGVIQLAPEEVEKYSSLPIIDDFEQGESSLGFFLAIFSRNIMLKAILCRHSISSRRERAVETLQLPIHHQLLQFSCQRSVTRSLA